MKNMFIHMSGKVWLAAFMTLCFAFPAFAQTIAVKGTVVDPEGEPLIGASVMIQGTSTGTATNIDGEYSLNAPADGSLVVSYVGYNTQTIAINGQTVINVTMKENAEVLDEVVVVGYGVVKKSDATGSVSVIKPSEVAAGMATSAQDLLVGASPGVVVTTNGGSPRGDASITIRGGASLAASNEPLIVIDGVPMERGSVIGSSNPIALVSPENIESMTVLKDASATAIFGSRASNGVIIITTKKGQSGKPQVSFAANLYVNTPRNYMNMMSGDEYAAFVRNHYGDNAAQNKYLGVDGTIYNTDWQKEVLRTSVSSDYSLSIGGTAGSVPYRVAVGYTGNNGIIRTSSMDRANASINLTPKFFDNTLSVNANLKGAYISNFYEGGGLGSAISFNPTLPVMMPGGNNFGGYTTYWSGGDLATMADKGRPNLLAAVNPVALINEHYSRSNVYQSIGNVQLDYKFPFLPELRANLNLGFEYNKGECSTYESPFSPQAWRSGHYVPGSDKEVYDGYASRNWEYQDRYNLLLDYFMNYNKSFDEIASTLDVTAGYSWQKFMDKKHNFSRVNAPGEEFDGYQRNATWYGSTPYQLVSFFGRVNYTFMDRYLITATVRADGTSRFSKDNRWGTFPSVALGWRVIEEGFMEPVRGWWNELKLRLGYGVTGQQDLPGIYFPYLPVYNGSTSMNEMYPVNGNNQYLVTPGWYNTKLKWEQTATWNAALDFGFLNNRISGSLDLYLRQTTDLLTWANFPAGSNLSNQGNLNLGDLENYGFEFNLLTRPVVTRDFTWQSNANIAYNKNKVTRLAEGANSTTGNVDGNDVMKHSEGHPAYSFWVYEQVYDADGKPLEGVFVDRNGDGVITSDDKYLFHAKDPALTVNWQNQFNYKNWDFGFNLRANVGNWVYNANEMQNSFIAGATAKTPLSNLMRDTYLWQSTRTTEITTSDYWVRNASFLRCDNITLGYTWDKFAGQPVRVRMFGAVQNPFVITKYNGLDPEVGGGIDNVIYPRPVTYTLGVVANF